MPTKEHRSSRNESNREKDYEREKDYDRDRDRDKDHDRTSRKRKDDKDEDEDYSKRKTKRFEEAPATASAVDGGFPALEPNLLNADKIKEMMANAKKMISKRKEELHIPDPAPLSSNTFMSDAMEKAKQAADIKARIQASFASLGAGGIVFPMPGAGGLAGLGATAPPAASAAAPLVSAGPKTGSGSAAKPAPLILDEEGRTIDASTGEVVEINRTYAPTLKANIRAKRREQFKTAIEKPPDEITDSKFYDSRVALKPQARSRRGFKFHEKGKFLMQASRLRTKAQLERLQSDIVQGARKTGIASAAKLASIAPKKELSLGEIPEIEWWDSFIVKDNSYDVPRNSAADDDKEHEGTLDPSRYDGITRLVEHPQQLKPLGDSAGPVVLPIILTKEERRKLRRQTRSETQKEKQEKIRLGLLPPPEPKVRMANLMRVLGTEAVQDPTKVEAHVRAQMAKRQKAHEEANAARKLTPNQRREKKIKKMTEDTSQGVHVAVFRVHDLKDPAKKFKIEANATQLFLTGLVVMCKDCNCVVVEGGPKQLKKFKHLMLHRLKWDIVDKKTAHKVKDDEDSDTEDARPASKKCFVIWEGFVTQRAFGDIRFKVCPTEAFAREQFKRCNVEHYWNLAYSSAVLEAAGVELAPAGSQATSA